MRKKRFFILSLIWMACMGVGNLFAQGYTYMQVHLLDNDKPQETELADISKVTFTTSGFTVIHNDASTQDFSYSNVNKITFNKGSNGIEANMVQSTLQVAPNPVGNTLYIKGYNASEGCTLAIYSAMGQQVLRLNDWCGEAVDVSHLTPGIYFINVNTTTTKFIKL